MKTVIAVLTLFVAVQCAAQESQQQKTPATLKSILLQQLRETHNQKNWFVSGKEAMAGLTPEQAAWNDGKNHSVGQLAQHLVFWNSQSLAQFKGEKPAAFSGNNNETFDSFDPAKWAQVKTDLDQVMKDWEDAVQKADDAKLAESASTIAHIGAHNAYHIGQMVYIRKLQGSWDPEKGVK